MALFARRLDEAPDCLAGYRVDGIDIADPDVVALSGMVRHLILRRDATAVNPVEGAALALDAAELPAADAYQGANYRRIEVLLVSGRRAFVYVAPDAM